MSDGIVSEVKKKGKWKRTVFDIVFFVVVFTLTIYGVFRGEDLNAVLRSLDTCDLRILIVPGILCVLFFILFESIVFKCLFSVLGINVKLTRCYLYSFVGFFFSCITPGAAGGQPVQLVFMKKDKLPLAESTLVMLLVTITYKLVLVVIGGLTLIIRPSKIMSAIEPVMFWIVLGMILNVGIIVMMFILVFWPKLAKIIVDGVISFLCFIKIFKDADKWKQSGYDLMDKYKDASHFMRSHKRTVFNAFLITLIQRLFLFFITVIVYFSFHLHGTPIIDILVLQSMIQVGADMLPLPGGMGITERLFLTIFEPTFGEDLVLPAMIVSRGFSYYIQLLLSAIMTVVAYIKIFNKKGEKE